MKCKISEMISKDLALRDSANRLFDFLASKRAKEATIDFSTVQTMTRAFAHQYLLNKKKTAIKIIEINVPAHVKKMFILACKPVEIKGKIRLKPIPLRLIL